jgi:hypothetical protein
MSTNKALYLMKLIAGVTLMAFLTGCGAYRVALKEGDVALAPVPDGAVEITKQNESPQGLHCFEPMLFFLTIGIVPTHCVDTYQVSTATTQSTYTVTQMQGWLTLLLLPLPSWHYTFGHRGHAETEVELYVRGGT